MFRASLMKGVVCFLCATSATCVINVPLKHVPKTASQLKDAALRRADRFQLLSELHVSANSLAVPIGAPKHALHTVSLTDFLDSEYFGEVDIGTAGQKFSVIYDTGSNSLWVPSKHCKNCKAHPRYDSAKSTTYQRNGTSFVNVYGSGACKGHVSKDRLVVAGLDISGFLFGEVTEETADTFHDAPFDGIVGLGPPGEFPAPLQMAKDQGKIDHNMFATYLASGGKSGSTLSIGGPDISYYTGGIFYIPTAESKQLNKMIGGGHWVITASDIKIGGKSTGIATDMVVDTGTSLLAGPSDQVDDLVSQIMGDGMAGFLVEMGVTVGMDCSAMHKLPVISFTFAGKDFDLGPDFYMIAAKDHQGKEQCHLGIQSLGQEAPFILGDPFLRKYYTVWDAENKRVGFALAVKGVGDTDVNVSQYTVEAAMAEEFLANHAVSLISVPVLSFLAAFVLLGFLVLSIVRRMTSLLAPVQETLLG